MSSNPHNPMNADSAEETLRLIASLPAPAGLEDRVHKALRAAPRGGRVLAWPAGFRARTVMQNHWMRAAAAAAIVFVVVGGGWGVYSRVQPGPAGKVIVMPPRAPDSGGFGGAGAIRAPQTLPGPQVREQGTQPVKQPAAAKKKIGSAQPAASQAAPQPAVSR
jgi:hypothetical protein